MTTRARVAPLALVGLAVLLNVLGAVTLKLLALQAHPAAFGVAAGLVAVLLLNGARFLLWGRIHSRYALSRSYPLTALFFPLILLVAYLFGEPVHPQQLVGTALIVAGIVVLTVTVPD